MIELALHIETLLLENDCVIVPNFGGFVTHYTFATRVKEENLFLPPTRTIGFNPQLKLNDGVLVQSYMSAHNTSFADATRMVEKDVAALIEHLHKEGKADLENIGEIHYNIYGSYEFIPHDFKITTPSLYGLDTFEMKELSVLQHKEKVLIPATLPKEKKTYEISINRAYLRNTAAAIAAIILFFAFSTPIENTNIQKSNYAQLLPAELFGLIEKQSVAVTPVQNKKSSVERVRTVKPIAVKEVKVSAKKEATSVAPVVLAAPTTPANNPFHIIIAGGISMKAAEAMAMQLKTQGFPEAITLKDEGKVRVSISSFSNREEATKQMLELRKNENYKNAWLLAK